MLSNLQNQERQLMSELWHLLFDDVTAPYVSMDALSRDILLQPISQLFANGFAHPLPAQHMHEQQQHLMHTALHCELATDKQQQHVNNQQQAPEVPVTKHQQHQHQQQQQQPGPQQQQQQHIHMQQRTGSNNLLPEQQSAAIEDIIQLQLTWRLVATVLQHHPDTMVRQQVHSAGLMSRLDQALSCWCLLGEVRRKIARSVGQEVQASSNHQTLKKWSEERNNCGGHVVSRCPVNYVAAAS